MEIDPLEYAEVPAALTEATLNEYEPPTASPAAALFTTQVMVGAVPVQVEGRTAPVEASATLYPVATSGSGVDTASSTFAVNRRETPPSVIVAVGAAEGARRTRAVVDPPSLAVPPSAEFE